MNHFSVAFCIHKQPYLGKAYILKLFTLEHGLVSFFIKGSQAKAFSYFYPLQKVKVFYEYKAEKNFQTFQEIQLIPNSIEQDIFSQTISGFISELMYKTQPYSEKNIRCYAFLEEVTSYLKTPMNKSLIPLYSLCKNLDILGLVPVYSDEKNSFEPFLNEQDLMVLKKLLQCNLSQDISKSCILDKNHRSILVKKILGYYQSHVLKSSEIKSYFIFEELFSEIYD